MTLSVCEEGALGLKSAAQPVKDRQTLSSEGEPISQRIAGVSVHRRPLQEDERGEPVRFTVPNGEFIPSLWCDAYFVSIRPNQVKGWVRHKLQDDRLFFLRDVIRVALFDDRPDSPTYHMLNVFVMSERNRVAW